jgi:hypothetical protein
MPLLPLLKVSYNGWRKYSTDSNSFTALSHGLGGQVLWVDRIKLGSVRLGLVVLGTLGAVAIFEVMLRFLLSYDALPALHNSDPVLVLDHGDYDA